MNETGNYEPDNRKTGLKIHYALHDIQIRGESAMQLSLVLYIMQSYE